MDMQKELELLKAEAARNCCYKFDFEDFQEFVNFVEENKGKGEEWVNDMNLAFEKGYWIGNNLGEKRRGEKALREMNEMRGKRRW